MSPLYAETDHAHSHRCRHERSHIVDSCFHGHGYATDTSRRIFCDLCRIQRWLDVEAALARSQGELGIIPEQAAKEIARCANLDELDLEPVAEAIKQTGHSLVSLLSALQQACSDDAGQFVHYGATTQDIQDTAQALEMRAVLDALDDGLRALMLKMVHLAQSHRDTLMIGRTHARPALPTTFGLKVVGWLDELLRHCERLEEMRPRVLVAELFGGVGTMAAFEGRGTLLLKRFAARLSLDPAGMGWHVARDRVAEFVTTLAMLCGTLGRVADEIRTLGRPEFNELEEGWHNGQVGSSTMPHKRNPEACEQVVALARLAKADAVLALDGMIHEHERDSRALRLEWVSVPEVSHYALASLAILDRVVGGLKVHKKAMAEHALAAAEAICTEALMLALSRRMGKQNAFGLVYEASHGAIDNGESLRARLSHIPDVTRYLSTADLDRIFDPAHYLGAARTLVDETVARAREWLTRS